MLELKELKEFVTYCPDSGVFTRLKYISSNAQKGDLCGYSNRPDKYGTIRINGILYYAHRLAWLYITGVWPEDQIDHINGDRSNNKFINLRCVNNTQNSRNKCLVPSNKSGYAGVFWYGREQRWKSYISANGKRVNLGTFKRKGTAIAVRKMAEDFYGYHENNGREKIAC